MFRLYAHKNDLQVLEKELLASGAVNSYRVQFAFSEEWDNLDKTAVFQVGSEIISVLLSEEDKEESTEEDDKSASEESIGADEKPLEGIEALFAEAPKYSCLIPWEILVEPRRTLFIGVYGSTGGGAIIPIEPEEPPEEEPGIDEVPPEEEGDGITGITFTEPDVDLDLDVGTDSDQDGGSEDEEEPEIKPDELTIVIPTVWADCGTIKRGAKIGETAQEPTPGLYEQVINALSNKADNLEYDGLDLSLKSGDKVLSTVPIIGGGSAGDGGTITIEGVISFNGRKGAVKPQSGDYTASMVGALPDTTIVPTKTSQLNNDSGFITKETDPTVPDWAKQPSKPTYTPAEIGADPAGTSATDAANAYKDAVDYTDDKLTSYLSNTGGTISGSVVFTGAQAKARETITGKRSAISADGIELTNETGSTTVISVGTDGNIELSNPNEEGGVVRLSGVANGTKDTDAVNKKQVQTVVDALNERIENISTGAGAGGDSLPTGGSDNQLLVIKDGEAVWSDLDDIGGASKEFAIKLTQQVIDGQSIINNDIINELHTKQDTLAGEEGQVVGFDANGNAVAQTLDLTSDVSLSAGDGITIEDDTISVTIPTKALTQEEYDALSEEERNASILYIIKDSQNIPNGGGNASLPSGSIIIWSGAKDNIPDGYVLCDGENGTPDLRDRFVLSAGEAHEVGDTGGEEEVTLTVEQIPAHYHTLSSSYTTSTTTSTSGVKYNLIRQTSSNGSTGWTTAYAGNSNPHTNMPPYYSLCYIMKL